MNLYSVIYSTVSSGRAAGALRKQFESKNDAVEFRNAMVAAGWDARLEDMPGR